MGTAARTAWVLSSLAAAMLAIASCDWGNPARPSDPELHGSTPAGSGSNFVGDAAGDDDVSVNAPNAGAIVLIGDAPSHGKREHEYRAGTILLKTMLEETPGVVARTLPSFPDSPLLLSGARAIILMAGGAEAHPLLVGKRAELLDAQLKRTNVGYAAIHFSTYPLEPLTPRVLQWAGGAFGPASVYAEWDASFDTLPDHPITHGVPPFSLRDEIYYQLLFANDAGAGADAGGVTPILRALQPTSNKVETVAWTWEREGGGRSFSYTGMHFHDRWLMDPIRRLIVNAILWVAGYDVPEAGAAVAMDPALIDQNLDQK
jgi:hypothetical protein